MDNLEKNMQYIHKKDVTVTAEGLSMALNSVYVEEVNDGWSLRDGQCLFVVPSDCECLRNRGAIVVYNRRGFMALIVEGV